MMAEEAPDEAERAGSRLEEGGLPPGKQRKGAIPWAWVWPLVVLPLLVVVLMAFQNKVCGAWCAAHRAAGLELVAVLRTPGTSAALPGWALHYMRLLGPVAGCALQGGATVVMRRLSGGGFLARRLWVLQLR